MDELFAKDLLDDAKMFDERLEFEFYELWHHEGRRARMGAVMMAPDYAWWHEFYELKNRCNKIMEEAGRLKQSGQPAKRTEDFPNSTGKTTDTF